MTPVNRFKLQGHIGPYKSWPGHSRVFVDGTLHRSLAVPGYILLHQYETSLGYVFITNYDCLFEEAITVTLVSAGLDRVIGFETISTWYTTYLLEEVEWLDEQHFRFTCDGFHGDWLVTLRAHHVPPSAPSVSITRRADGTSPTPPLQRIGGD